MRERLIQHILTMKRLDEDYAREAFTFYNKLLPWMELGKGVRDAMG